MSGKQCQETETRETRELPVRLLDSELKVKSDQLVQMLQDMQKVRAERELFLATAKEAKTVFNKREDEIYKRVQELGGEIANRTERRQVECALHYHWDRGLVEIARTDSGEVVDQRSITAEERQQKMPFAGAYETASESVQ
ncbi:MAG: hypothetical protein AABN33_18240 [Acidobacteriota bacterium]